MNLDFLKDLVGVDGMKVIMFITVHWNESDAAASSRRESELENMWFKPFLEKGAVVARFFAANAKSAEALVQQAIDRSQRVPLQIQSEMMVSRLPYEQTSAYRQQRGGHLLMKPALAGVSNPNLKVKAATYERYAAHTFHTFKPPVLQHDSAIPAGSALLETR